MTAGESITLRVAQALETCGISFLLSGSFASNYYGIPRSTRDADFVLQSQHPVGPEFAEQLGEGFFLEPQLSCETNTGTFRQVQARFSRRRAVRLFERQVWLPSPEDVIITKLRWARGKDKDDVRDVMAVQQDSLDWRYIEDWCRRLGTLPLMAEIRRSISVS